MRMSGMGATRWLGSVDDGVLWWDFRVWDEMIDMGGLGLTTLIDVMSCRRWRWGCRYHIHTDYTFRSTLHALKNTSSIYFS